MKTNKTNRILSHLKPIFNLFLILLLSLSVISCEKDEPDEISQWLKVASFNIEYDNAGNWSARKAMVKELLEGYNFDLIGIQEPFSRQIADIMGFLPDYAFVGSNVQGTSKDGILANYIVYKKSRLTLLDSGFFWYSETPETLSKGWDAGQYRVCVWAKLKDLTTNKEFYHFNSHFDNTGSVAQAESAKMLVERVSSIADEYPIVLTGDFNASQSSEAYQLITSAGILADSFRWSVEKDNIYWSTYNDYEYPIVSTSKSRIDHVFFTNGNSSVPYWKIINDAFNNKYPSDHFPVMIHWDLNK